MMGGGSQFQVDRGHVELCAPVTPDAQQLAVYGVQSPKPSHTLKPTEVVTNTGFANPVHALTSGEQPTLPGCSQPTDTASCTADAVLDPTKRQSASMQLAGFTPQVPPGSVITSATLHVKHEDDGNLTAPGAVKVTTAVGGDTCRTDNLPRHTALATDPPIDLLGACGLTNPARLTGLTVTYAATLDAGGTAATERLDGIWLEVAYRTPTTFKPTAVTASTGFTANGTDPVNALEIGEQPTPLVAGADLTTAAPSASITLAGFGQPPLQPGSTIDSAVLRVAHRETGDAAAPRINVTPAGGGDSCTNLPLTARPGLGDDRVDLKACGISDAAQLTGLTATYTAGLKPGGSAGADSLDGIWLEIVHDPPPPRPATSAKSTTFVPAANAEAIDGANTAHATLDSVTAPAATIDLGGYDTLRWRPARSWTRPCCTSRIATSPGGRRTAADGRGHPDRARPTLLLHHLAEPRHAPGRPGHRHPGPGRHLRADRPRPADRPGRDLHRHPRHRQHHRHRSARRRHPGTGLPIPDHGTAHQGGQHRDADRRGVPQPGERASDRFRQLDRDACHGHSVGVDPARRVRDAAPAGGGGDRQGRAARSAPGRRHHPRTALADKATHGRADRLRHRHRLRHGPRPDRP
ncbi:hypothetical protein O1L55_25300 [Streptomyces albulus]|nr:hypothetical protein [Streptomyces noursei]